MAASDTELIFPPAIIPVLRDQHGPGWQNLVDQVWAAPANSEIQAAFVLMMARLNGCANCHGDSYRAMQGCLACSRQSLKRVQDADRHLANVLHSSLQEVHDHITQHP